MRRNDAEFKLDQRQTSTQLPAASREAKSANTSEQVAKSKVPARSSSRPDKRQTSTQPTTASTEAKSANTAEQADKSKPDKRQTSTQPVPASGKAKSANTSELAAIDDFFEVAQRLRLKGYSGKDLAELLIMQLVMRIHTLVRRIEKAFAEQPFYPGLAPEAKANQLRLNVYVTDYALAVKLLGSAIEVSKTISTMTTTKPTGTGAEDAR